jgi:hypothetical protein
MAEDAVSREPFSKALGIKYIPCARVNSRRDVALQLKPGAPLKTLT